MTLDELIPLLGELHYEHDARKPPDNYRKGQFKAGWEDAAIREKTYDEETLQRLTWHNLGYRLGLLSGPRSTEEIYEIFVMLAKLYRNRKAS
jgi:5-methylcytosine-specific restriction protein A